MSGPDAVGIAGAAYRIPPGRISVRSLLERHRRELDELRREVLQLPYLRAIDLLEVESVPVFDGEDPGTLALAAARELLAERGVEGGDLGLVIDYSTVSRDSNGLSLCYRIQDELGAHRALPIAIGNGSCTSLQLALRAAVAFLSSHPHMELALLFAEDRVRGRRYYPPFKVLGDGASALLLQRGDSGAAIVDTEVSAMGAFRHILGINTWEPDNLDVAEFENRIVPLHYRVMHDLASKLLERHGLALGDVSLFLYENMSVNALSGLARFLEVEPERVFRNGLAGHGHIFGSDLVINLKLAQSENLIQPCANLLLLSSGAGFTWAATLLQT